MADYIVPPKRRKDLPILKCSKCGTLYVADFEKVMYGLNWYYEPCPICKFNQNDDMDRIPLWKYNLIKWFRGGFKKEGEGKDNGKK